MPLSFKILYSLYLWLRWYCLFPAMSIRTSSILQSPSSSLKHNRFAIGNSSLCPASFTAAYHHVSTSGFGPLDDLSPFVKWLQQTFLWYQMFPWDQLNLPDNVWQILFAIFRSILRQFDHVCDFTLQCITDFGQRLHADSFILSHIGDHIGSQPRCYTKIFFSHVRGHWNLNSHLTFIIDIRFTKVSLKNTLVPVIKRLASSISAMT